MNNRHSDYFSDHFEDINNHTDTTEKELESIEYIIPSGKKTKKHKHRHHKRFSKVTRHGDISSVDDFVFAQPKSKKKKKSGLKIFGIVMGVIAAILVLCTATVLIFNQVGKSIMHDYDDMSIEPPVEQIESVESIENDGKTIKYNGETYVFNDQIATVTLLGIDIKEDDNNPAVGTNGQADAIYIAVIDTRNDKVSILGVSRDTIVDVNVYNESGGFVRTEPMQICLAHAYGDGAHTSCENMMTSLQRLFYGMQYDTYFSINQDALATLTDAVGGVTLTSDTDFYSYYYGRTITKGETVTIYGNDAKKYLRARDLEELDSNNDRMGRQIQFMTAFLAQVWDSVKSKPSTIVDLYNTIDDNSTTNLTPSKMTYLASTAISSLDSYKDVDFVSIQGTVEKGEYAEFYPDEDKLMQTMLDLFYIKLI